MSRSKNGRPTSRLPLRPATAGVFLLAVASHTPGQVTDMTLLGTSFHGKFGTAIDSIGDVNNDGRPDFAVGRPDDGSSGVGVVTIYSGATKAVLKTLIGVKDADFGLAVAGAGDVNKDGVPDVIVGSPAYTSGGSMRGRADVFSGKDWTILRTFLGPEAGSEFGHAVDGAGDVNHDGYADVVVGAYGADFEGKLNHGLVQVYSGQSGTVLHSWYGPDDFIQWGYSVAGMGDMNGDGYADIAIGAPDDDTSAFNGGFATVKSGLNGGTIFSTIGFESGGHHGASVCGADVNGDGKMDLVVGARGDGSHAGYVKVFPGPWGGAALWTVPGSNVDDGFGHAVVNAGDVNQDGKHDVLAGAPQTYIGSGYAKILSGAHGGTLWLPMMGYDNGSRFGVALAALGDLDGDGWLEVAVGAPLEDASSTTDSGAVRVVHAFVEQLDLGNGGPGGAKLRVYGGALSSGNQADMRLQYAPVNNPAFLLAAPTVGYLPYKAGVIVPSLLGNFLLFPMMTNGAGEVTLEGIPGGYGKFPIYTQFILPYKGAPGGFLFSNAVRIDMLQ